MTTHLRHILHTTHASEYSHNGQLGSRQHDNIYDINVQQHEQDDTHYTTPLADEEPTDIQLVTYYMPRNQGK